MNGSGHIDEARLLALGLGEAPSALEAQHLAGCAACAAAPEADAQLWGLFRQLPWPEPPPSFAAATLAGFRRARAVRHRPRDVLVGALVMGVLAAVLCFWTWRQAPGAMVSVALALPHWSGALSLGVSLARLVDAALPALVLGAGALLAAVALMLRRLALVAAK